MAGHSKFKNIMHRKGAQDKKEPRFFQDLEEKYLLQLKLEVLILSQILDYDQQFLQLNP